MTRSHVLLHSPNEKLVAAREEAWEGKNRGGVRVLLANPRWERRFVRFLELSDVGRTMAGRTDEEGACAAKKACFSFSFFHISRLLGYSYPETCAQWRATDFFCSS